VVTSRRWRGGTRASVLSARTREGENDGERRSCRFSVAMDAHGERD